jgi:two-component system, NtrC family, sensor kinase
VVERNESRMADVATLAGRPRPTAAQVQTTFPGLRARLLIFYVLLVLALALAGTYIVTRLVAASAAERLENHLREASRGAADTVARLELRHLEQLRRMAQTEGAWQALEAGDAAALQGLLAPLAAASDLQVAAAIDLAGRDLLTLYREPGRPELAISAGSDYSGLEPVAAVLRGEGDAAGDKFTAMAAFPSGAYLLSSAPVHDAAGTVVGVMLVGTRLEVLLTDLRAHTLGDIVLLDGSGALVATTLAEPASGYAALELQPGSLPPPGRALMTDLELNNREYRAIYTPLMLRQSPAGALGVVLSSDYIAGSLATSRSTILWLFTVGTLVVMVVGLALASSVISPIVRLRDVARAAAAGDMSQTTGVSGSDEVGTLAQSVDALIRRLRDNETEVHRLYDEIARRNRLLNEQHARLQAQQKQLARAERLAAVGQLAAGMVHEIKNPLSVVIGTVDIMREHRETGEQIERDLQVVRDSAVKANRIAGDMLRFARPAEPNYGEHDLRLSVANALQLTSYLARERRVRLKANLPEDPVFAEYDADQIEQVFVNLLLNGLQAMPDGGTMAVHMRQMPEAAVVAIQDTGPGIATEELARVFDPFYTTRASEGTGLGLSVSDNIVRAHHGRLDAASKPGHGSIFSVWLPARQPELHPAEPASVAQESR